eukprot:CAMPEP_0168490658 /NCGR_PEP_ID=MMETSP0228-20121227/69298_1 /TAXON_ID=133427 /ORGANISM="Protoceratium reticulatum, Strain CCCM 535 (=CCMP 1889)" /LENGTH=86 /DNA_ID=CAMNT_0008507379 /DNA_START=70 /DNA_END=326 /DNA_ORIENTATION=-
MLHELARVLNHVAIQGMIDVKEVALTVNFHMAALRVRKRPHQGALEVSARAAPPLLAVFTNRPGGSVASWPQRRLPFLCQLLAVER